MENTYPNRCEEVLAHHGVKGMKWGVRRYQNPDGSLTAAGEKRYAGEKGKKRLIKDHKKDLKGRAMKARSEANINARILERSEKELNKSQKRYENSAIKNPDSKKTARLKRDRDIRRILNDAAKISSKTSLENAKRLTEDMVRQFGDKSIKELKYDKHGRVVDPTDTMRKLGNVGAWMTAGGMAMVNPIGIGIGVGQSTNKDISRIRYNVAYAYESARLKELEKEKYRK